MYRSLTISLALLATASSAFAQLPPYTLHFVSDESDSWPRASKISSYLFQETVATPEYLVHIERAMAGKTKNVFTTFVRDNATGGNAGKYERPFPGGEDAYFDRILFVSGKLYLIYEVLDRKSGEVKVLAEQIALPSGEPEGPAKEIGKISFDPKSLTWSGKLGVELHTSENGEYTAFYFDRIRSKEDEQLVMIFMLDGELDPVWEQGYRIEFDSEKISTSGVSVSDDGIVYALMGARFKNKAITNKEVNYEYQLFGMSKEGMARQSITVESGNDVLSCGLTLRSGKLPCVGGFFVESGASTEVTAGYFVTDVDPAMEQPPTTESHRFRTPVEERMYGPKLFARSNGAVFLTGNSRKNNGTSASESALFAAAFDASLAEEWSTVVPKSLITSKSDEDYSYRPFFGKDRLLIMVPEVDENLPVHQNGGELKKIRKGADIRMVVGFSDSGAPSFAKFGAPVDYNLSVRYLPWDMEVADNVYAIPCTKGKGKEAVYGKLLLTFE